MSPDKFLLFPKTLFSGMSHLVNAITLLSVDQAASLERTFVFSTKDHFTYF